MVLGTLASRGLGFIRQAVFNNLFADPVKDAFNVALRVPNLFREVLAEGAVTNALIPVLKSLPETEQKAFQSRFGAFLLGINLLVLGLGWVLAPYFVALLLSESSAIDPELATYLTRLVMPFLTGISMSALLSAILQAEERFFPTAFAPVAFNLVAIGLMLVFPGNVTALGLSFSLAGIVQALVNLPFLRGWRMSWGWHPAIGRALLLMGPFVFTTSVRQFLNVVLTILLTSYPLAAVTGFYNAELVFQMSLGVLAVSPAMALYPRLAELGAAFDMKSTRELVGQALPRVAGFLGLASALFGALAPWTISVLYAWSDNFSFENAQFSTQALQGLALAIFPWGLNAILVRMHYARQEVVQAVRVTVAVFLLNTLGYYLLAPYGMFMLNLATAGAGWLGSTVYALQLARAQALDLGALAILTLKVAIGAVVTALVAYQVAAWVGPAGLAWDSLLPLAAGGLSGVLVYYLLARLLGIKWLRR